MSFTLGIIIILTSNAILFNIPTSQGLPAQGYKVARLSDVLTPLENLTYMTFGTLPSRVSYSPANRAYVVKGHSGNFRNDLAKKRKDDQRKYKMMPRWEYLLRRMVPNVGLPFGYLKDLMGKGSSISPRLLGFLGQGTGGDKDNDDLDDVTDDGLDDDTDNENGTDDGNGTNDEGTGTDDGNDTNDGDGTDDGRAGADDKGTGTDDGNDTNDGGAGANDEGNDTNDKGDGTGDKGDGTGDKGDDTNDVRDSDDNGDGQSKPKKDDKGGYKFPSFPSIPFKPSMPSMPSSFPSMPSMPSSFPSMPSMPSSFPSMPSMPSSFPSMPSMPSSFPSMPSMPSSFPSLWNSGNKNGDGTGTDYKQKMKDVLQSDLTKSLAKSGIGMLPGGNAAMTALDIGSKLMNKGGQDEVMDDLVEDAVESDVGQSAIKGFIGFLPGGDKIVKAMEAGSKMEKATKKIPGI